MSRRKKNKEFKREFIPSTLEPTKKLNIDKLALDLKALSILADKATRIVNHIQAAEDKNGGLVF